jgi:hypothetical protein
MYLENNLFIFFGEISGSHGGGYEEDSHLHVCFSVKLYPVMKKSALVIRLFK